VNATSFSRGNLQARHGQVVLARPFDDDRRARRSDVLAGTELVDGRTAFDGPSGSSASRKYGAKREPACALTVSGVPSQRRSRRRRPRLRGRGRSPSRRAPRRRDRARPRPPSRPRRRARRGCRSTRRRPRRCSPVVGSSRIDQVPGPASASAARASALRLAAAQTSRGLPHAKVPEAHVDQRRERAHELLRRGNARHRVGALMASTSATLCPRTRSSSTSSRNRRPLQSGHVKLTSARNCISTVSKPSPSHVGQRPPSTLKRERARRVPALLGLWERSKRGANALVRALRYVAALPRVVRPSGPGRRRSRRELLDAHEAS
jgi:hypothetical protein